MHLMSSALLLLLAVVGVIVFISGLTVTIVDTSLFVPDPTEPPSTTVKSTTTTPRPFSCKRMLLVMSKRVFHQFGICNRDMKVFIPNDKDREKKIQCAVKCVLKKMKVVNERDLINEQSMQTFLASFLPEEFQEMAHIILGGCVEEFVAKGEIPLHEDYCESYGEFLHCIQDNFSGACR
ncbi:unnamed protein product [Allacma fusca]|uniref:Uncharacterized protein n=1 Tax=Allacma fusca TaxID=39272 RepID=A0A8J2K011_9HEXA|nr:unnamed protein product [Allacma fusca]